MSLFPYFFRDVARPLRMMENQMRMTEELIKDAFYAPGVVLKYRRNGPILQRNDVESVIDDKDKFQVGKNTNIL